MVLTACKAEFHDLLECVAQTACIEQGGSVKQCMRDPAVVEACEKYRYAYFLCRRGQLDMRSRLATKDFDPAKDK
jgi:hypothetical protein